MRDVLDAQLARIVERQVELALEVVIGGSRDHHPAGLAELLQPRGDVYAVPEQILALNHHVAQVDPDPEHDPPLRRHLRLAGCGPGLNGEGTGDRIDHGAELRQRPVAHQLDDTATMLGQQRVDHAAADIPQGRQRTLLVLLDEARITDHIGRQDRGQPSLGPGTRHRTASCDDPCPSRLAQNLTRCSPHDHNRN